MKKIYLALLLCLVSLTAAWAQQPARCQGIQIVPSQDCKNAIPLCGLRYTYPTGAICGPGNVVNEIPTGSCLSSDERNTTWYVFKVRKSGLLKFAIVPLDAVNPSDSGSLDYDWGLFKLPPGTVNTDAVCTQLANTLSFQVSCNYSADKGATGILDTSGMEPVNTQGAAGTKWNQPLFVNRDEVYVLAVDNFTGDTALTGYTIRFRDTLDLRSPDDFARGIADITPAGELPRLDSVLRSANCVNNGVLFSFNKEILCESVNDGDITVINLANPNLVINVDTFFAANGCAGGISQDWIIRISPVIIDSNYAVIIQDSIIDICGKVLISDTLKFRVNKFVRLESYVTDVQQDTVCSGDPIEVRAIPDENLEARIRDFTYTWSLLDSATGTETPLVSSDSFLIDTNIVTVTRHVPLRTSITFIVEARGVTTNCQDRDTMTIYINPLPTALVNTPVLSCFGEPQNITVGNPADSTYYTYKWTSNLARPAARVPQYAQFQAVSDTVNTFSTGRDTAQHRFQHDVFKVIVAYKPQFGGCALPQQTLNFYAGKYMAPFYDVDSLARPDKKGLYVLDTNTFYNKSAFRTRNSNQFVGEVWDFGDSNIVRQPGVSASVQHRFEAPGQYRVSLTMVDSVLPGLYCTKTFTRLLEFVPSYWETGRRGEFGFLPNIVTPNGDHKNDYLEFVGLPTDAYALEVYNRWGKKVYSISPYNNTWKPNDIDRGVYFYRLKKVRAQVPSANEVSGWFEVIY